MPSNMDDESSRRNYREESWTNDHEDRQHVFYQLGEESDSKWKNQTHQNKVLLPERAGREWKVDYGVLQIRESDCRYNDKDCACRIVQEIKNNDECR
jgi:hypothetical protein